MTVAKAAIIKLYLVKGLVEFMLSLTKDENRQKQAKLGALVATAALATTFAGATAVHADTVGSAPQPAGQVHKTSQTVGFKSAAGSTGTSTATSTGKVSSSAVASNAQSGAGSSAASGSTAKSDAKSDAGSAASSATSSATSSAASSAGSQSGASSANSSASSSGDSSTGSSATSGTWVNTDVEKHAVRTVRITTPNGRTQDYTQTVKLTRTKSEKDGKVVYSAWTDGEWKAFPLVPIDGYNWMINGQEYAPQKDANGKYKAEELPSVKVTDQTGDSLVTVTYKKIGSMNDNKDQGSDTNSNADSNSNSNSDSNAGSSATNSSAASGSNESGQGSNGSSVNDGKTATNGVDASTTTTAGLGDVMANGANAGTVTTTASPAGTVNGVSASAPAGAVIGSGAKAGQLPQTGAQSEAGLAALGVAGMLAALGVSKVGKKREA